MLNYFILVQKLLGHIVLGQECQLIIMAKLDIVCIITIINRFPLNHILLKIIFILYFRNSFN